MRILFLISLFTTLSFAFGVVQGDKEYFKDEGEKLDVVYPKEYKKEAGVVKGYVEDIFKEYDRSFYHSLSDKPTLILGSSCNQVTNATATVVPNSIMTWYGGGVDAIDYFNSTDWSKTLALHETAHIYQLDAKSETSEALHSVFGSPMMPLFVWWIPIFINPNLITPDFFLEGNAVLNESRFGNGGRLYGGRHRALFLSLLKGGKLGATRLINNHEDFPYMEEKYIVGGYFFEYLGREYGIDKTNSFFKHHGDRYINPLNLSKTTNKVFGKPLTALINEFLKEWSDEAREFKETKGELIATSKRSTSFGKDGDKALFLTDDLVSFPKLYSMDKKGNIEITEGDFFTGKPFKIGDKYYTKASTLVDNYKIAYSLFDKDREENRKFRSAIVQDVMGEDILYFRGDRFGSSTLYHNKKRVGEVASSAMFDERKNYYYFKQEGKRRVLYKNSMALFSLRGFDSKVVDISGGVIYFTAPTKLGTSLYSYENGSVFKVGEGDDIVDAKHLKEDMFLVNSVTANGYEYKLSLLKKRRDLPATWEYTFESAKVYHTEYLEHGESHVEEHEYGYLQEMKFNSLYPTFSILENNGYSAGLAAYFSDPLNQNSLTLSYFDTKEKYGDGSEDRDTTAMLSYFNNRYRASFGTTYAGFNEESVASNERNYYLDLFVSYPFLLNSRENFSVTLKKYYDHNSKKFEPHLLIGNYTRDINFPFALFSKSYYNLEMYSREHKEDLTSGVSVTVGKSIGESFYLDLNAKISRSNRGIIKLDNPDYLVYDPADFTMYDVPFIYFSDEMQSIRLGGKAAIDESLYFKLFPLSLKNSTLFAYREHLQLNLNEKYKDITEDVIGLDLNLLAVHRFDLPLRVMYVMNSEVNEDERGKLFFSLMVDY